ncbi:PASTA domain-containing protein [Actinoplanes sp. CA-030573]|uniref:PASTA domain-containing protein n=1 Tax=Actinoplanes sp. CA-030573 TaxID=3239898 RepID=UPI003D8A3CAE
MSDESDETRVTPPASPPSPGDDATQVAPQPPLDDDATQVAPQPPLDDDATRVAPLPSDVDATRVAPRPDSTSVMPPATDDWAASRANPVWSGRAEVRAPQPGLAGYDTDWSDGPAPVSAPGQRDRWWMPIIVGIVVLVLLALLGWGVYVIMQNSGDEPGPATTPSTVATTMTTEPSSAPPTTTAPSSQPTTTTPSVSPTTTEPTTTEVVVPALRGLSLAEARAALDRSGLRYRVLYRNSTAAPEGTVIDSDPAEGQEVPPDTRVTIVVSQPQGATTTPTATATATTPATGGN